MVSFVIELFNHIMRITLLKVDNSLRQERGNRTLIAADSIGKTYLVKAASAASASRQDFSAHFQQLLPLHLVNKIKK